MTKVYPKSTAATDRQLKSDGNAVILTVWKKSLLFNCDGFTVFDGKGNLVFRVDNYVAGSKTEIVLMDASGSSLLTVRRKRLSFGDNWLVFDEETAVNPRFSARKHVNLLNTKSIAHVSSGCSGTGSSSSPKKNVIYEIEGSYAQRNVAIYDDKRRRVAEIKRKETASGVAFGLDVFRLIVQPEMDSTVAMSLVILLDQMFGSSRRFSP
ncbi:hypothetical protein LguiB_035531 [Lonicera macranthoides]